MSAFHPHHAGMLMSLGRRVSFSHRGISSNSRKSRCFSARVHGLWNTKCSSGWIRDLPLIYIIEITPKRNESSSSMTYEFLRSRTNNLEGQIGNIKEQNERIEDEFRAIKKQTTDICEKIEKLDKQIQNVTTYSKLRETSPELFDSDGQLSTDVKELELERRVNEMDGRIENLENLVYNENATIRKQFAESKVELNNLKIQMDDFGTSKLRNRFSNVYDRITSLEGGFRRTQNSISYFERCLKDANTQIDMVEEFKSEYKLALMDECEKRFSAYENKLNQLTKRIETFDVQKFNESPASCSRYCSICDVVCLNDNEYSNHIHGLKHVQIKKQIEHLSKLCLPLKFAFSELVSRKNIPDQTPDSKNDGEWFLKIASKNEATESRLETDSLLYCALCDRSLPPKDYCTHVDGIRHRRVASVLKELSEYDPAIKSFINDLALKSSPLPKSRLEPFPPSSSRSNQNKDADTTDSRCDHIPNQTQYESLITNIANIMSQTQSLETKISKGFKRIPFQMFGTLLFFTVAGFFGVNTLLFYLYPIAPKT